jgi:hypothetical protein
METTDLSDNIIPVDKVLRSWIDPETKVSTISPGMGGTYQ